MIRLGKSWASIYICTAICVLICSIILGHESRHRIHLTRRIYSAMCSPSVENACAHHRTIDEGIKLVFFFYSFVSQVLNSVPPMLAYICPYSRFKRYEKCKISIANGRTGRSDGERKRARDALYLRFERIHRVLVHVESTQHFRLHSQKTIQPTLEPKANKMFFFSVFNITSPYRSDC